jgi:uncharacterized protein (TIGR00251 family)
MILDGSDSKSTRRRELFRQGTPARAKKTAITGQVGETLKLSITAPPADGKANDACIDFFAKLLRVPRSSVTITSGQRSRNKTIRVSRLAADEVKARLAI